MTDLLVRSSIDALAHPLESIQMDTGEVAPYATRVKALLEATTRGIPNGTSRDALLTSRLLEEIVSNPVEYVKHQLQSIECRPQDKLLDAEKWQTRMQHVEEKTNPVDGTQGVDVVHRYASYLELAAGFAWDRYHFKPGTWQRLQNGHQLGVGPDVRQSLNAVEGQSIIDAARVLDTSVAAGVAQTALTHVVELQPFPLAS